MWQSSAVGATKMSNLPVYLQLLLLLGARCLATPMPMPTPTTTEQPPLKEMQLLQPHILTIERLESLLKRAGEIFGAATAPQEAAAQPQQQMLPPTNQPYNFYLPLFDYEDPKLDAKSRHLEKILPPPKTAAPEHNYYAAKPKKSPKKFNATAKHVNLKWLNAYERALGSVAPTAIYLEQDERNRINFDDSFFAADVQLRLPHNQPHTEQATTTLADDLLAAPAQLSYNYRQAPRA